MRPLTAFDSLSWAGEGSKGRGSPLASQGRLAQLEERLVCNQKAGGSNPPASTLPLFVGDVAALPRAFLTAHSSARWPQRPPSLFGLAVSGFCCEKT